MLSRRWEMAAVMADIDDDDDNDSKGDGGDDSERASDRRRKSRINGFQLVLYFFSFSFNHHVRPADANIIQKLHCRRRRQVQKVSCRWLGHCRPQRAQQRTKAVANVVHIRGFNYARAGRWWVFIVSAKLY